MDLRRCEFPGWVIVPIHEEVALPADETLMTIENPYAPPESDSGSDRFSLLPAIGFLFGLLLLAASAGSVLYIVYLNLRFPGLYDPTTRPITYWPEIDAMVFGALAVITGAVGLPIFWKSRTSLQSTARRGGSFS